MSPDKAKKLLTAFPEMYANLRSEQFECGDGWFDIIYELSKDLQDIFATYDSSNYKENESYYQKYCTFSIVKQKFGALRFQGRVSGDNEAYERQIENLIDNCEEKSASTCEQCGSLGTLLNINGWFRVACEQCENARKFKLLLD